MTREQLKDRVSVLWIGYGTYKIKIKYRRQTYFCTSHNSLAYDRIKCDELEENKSVIGFYTYKQALQAFYEECKRENCLGECNY